MREATHAIRVLSTVRPALTTTTLWTASNGCDPEPFMRNRIDVFEGFNNTVAPVGAVVGGTWTFSGGQATSNSPGTQFSTISWPEPTSTTVMVSAQFTINTFDPTQPQNYIGVADHIASGTVTRCSLTGLNNGLLEIASNGQRFMSQPTPVMAGTTAVTVSTRVDTSYKCVEAVRSTS